jgi:hypothetical protein
MRLIFTFPQSTSEYEYAVLPKKSSSSGFTVNRAGYIPDNIPEYRTLLFLPKFTCTATRCAEQSFTIRLTSEMLLVGLIIR